MQSFKKNISSFVVGERHGQAKTVELLSTFHVVDILLLLFFVFNQAHLCELPNI